MQKDKQETQNGLPEIGLGLDELVRRGARQVIQQAIEAELAELLAQYANVKTLSGRQAVVRNGYLPERDIVTAAGPVPVKVPKVRDRSGTGVKFNSSVVPPYVRKSPRVSATLPWLYLKGISTGNMGDALSVLLGEDAKGLSANVVSRLKAQWAEEWKHWDKRDLSACRWVYWWVDGIHTGARSEDHDGQCLLVIIGVTPDGKKERVAIADGFRESKASWVEVLLDLKARGLQSGPRLAIGDGAMGFWAALEEVFPSTTAQRCWFHKLGNVLNALPATLQSKAKAGLQAIFMAETRADAISAFGKFVSTYGAKYPKAVEKLAQDKDSLLAFYDFPRYVQDLPCSGQRLRLTVEVRRFQCRNPACARRTFSVAPPLVNRYQRHTNRVQTVLWHVGLALGGAAGARLVNHLGLVASGDTILRTLRRMSAQERPGSEDSSLQHIGIDDWAFRRGHHYGTIVVDLDRRMPVDLLPDRDTCTVTTWLSSKCGICTVARDRSNAYADAISQGAPQAMQVADHWHLLKNLGDAIERLLLRRQSDLREAARQLSPPKPIETPAEDKATQQSKVQRQVSLQKRSRRLANYQQVVQLRHNGMSISAISRTMKLDRRTVRNWLRAEVFPERACRPPRVSKLAPIEPYLLRRWKEGCHNASMLMREIVDKGYRGGSSILHQRLQEWRRTMPETARGRNIVIPSARSVCAWLLGLEYRSDVEVESRRQFIDLLCKLSPQISESRHLAQQFIAMVRKEIPAQLDNWIRQVCVSGVQELRSFAEGLKQDYAAVSAALTSSYSNGMTEGHINRLKMIKRQMYGRASLTLLRIRVLHRE